jgi:hypothetical protein
MVSGSHRKNRDDSKSDMKVLTATMVAAKSLFGKVYPPLASRFSIRRIMATSMNVSLVCTFRS